MAYLSFREDEDRDFENDLPEEFLTNSDYLREEYLAEAKEINYRDRWFGDERSVEFEEEYTLCQQNEYAY